MILKIKKEITKFLKTNPKPKDDQIHKLAEDLNINKHKFEKYIYELLAEFISNPVGKHNDIPDSEFDPKELKMGIEVEQEHSDIIEIRKSITKDHLAECSTYYTRLNKMEKECEDKKKINENIIDDYINKYLDLI